MMVTGLGPQLETLPELAARHARLSQLMAQAEELEARQAQLKADLQELNGQRRDLVKAGEEVRSRIGAVLRAEHGFTSERLLEFALKPKRIPIRGRKPSAERQAETFLRHVLPVPLPRAPARAPCRPEPPTHQLGRRDQGTAPMRVAVVGVRSRRVSHEELPNLAVNAQLGRCRTEGVS
jgi:hypothetical protein